MDEADRMHGTPLEAADLVALVETPGWGDAKFFGQWLLAVAEAQQALGIAFELDPPLRQRFDLPPPFDPFNVRLGINAMGCLRHSDFSCTFVIDMDGPVSYEFFILVQLGLFVRTGTRYQMTIPPTHHAESCSYRDQATDEHRRRRWLSI
jgi:hypothetical protein